MKPPAKLMHGGGGAGKGGGGRGGLLREKSHGVVGQPQIAEYWLKQDDSS